MKKSLYPKTKRIVDSKILITEKLDGSNIGFFNIKGNLIIATRNNVINYSEIVDNKNLLYKGMYGWLSENANILNESLHPGSGFFGEWIGMGKIKYPDFSKKVYMFAKANITDTLDIKNIFYDPHLFQYPFVDQRKPEFIGIIETVKELRFPPSIEHLDRLYDLYCEDLERHVEGFIIIYNNIISKYVRMKNGDLSEFKF